MDNSNGKLSAKYLSNCINNEDFIMEFFPELEVPEIPLNMKETKQEENFVNGHSSLINDLSNQNEKLKQMNNELKEKSLAQESQIAKYEVDLSQKMQLVLTTNQELDEVKERYEKANCDKENIEKEMTQLKAQIAQLLDTREENNQANIQIADLQKDVSLKDKAMKKLKNDLTLSAQKLSEKSNQAKKLKSANKRLWNLISEMAETLSNHGVLTVKKKEKCLKEVDEQMTEFASEVESVKAFLCGLSTSPAPVPPREAENNFSKPTNYFLRSHREVIEDLVSEDYDELNNFRQQLSIRKDPISPLPPTPPPKSAMLSRSSIGQPPSTRSSAFAGKKLNFFHQQSESFDVEQIVEPPVEKATSPKAPLSMSQYTISSKLNEDGSLKLDFSAHYDTHLSFDMNTRKVSCTVMPTSSLLPPPQPISQGATQDEKTSKRVKLSAKRPTSEKKQSDSSATGETTCLPQEKKMLNDIGRCDRVYSAFVPPSSEKQVTVIPSVRVSPRQVNVVPSKCIEADTHNGTSVSPKKQKKRTKKVKSSDDLFQSSSDGSKNNRIIKRRKTVDFEKCDDMSKPCDSHNEEEIKTGHLIDTINACASPTSSSLKLTSELHKEEVPSVQPPSDHISVPCAVNPEDVVTMELPEKDDKLCNEMDFSDIQVGPFNPSTFIPRGLFEDVAATLDDCQKSDIIQTTDDCEQDVAFPLNGEQMPPPLESTSQKPTKSPSDDHKTIETPNAMTNGHSNPLMDGLDSDHSLVIAEDIEVNAECVENGAKAGEGRRGKKKKRMKKCPQRKEEAAATATAVGEALTIEAAFKSLEEMKFTDAHFKQNQHTLVNALVNPSNAAGCREVAFQVLKQLMGSRANPLIGYYMSEGDASLLMPLKEKCIVQALLQIGRKKKAARLQGLLPSLLGTAFDLVVAKDSLGIYGCACLCRVLTELCRRLGDERLPLMLCGELLKLQHRFAPYLIASVVSVWRELFTKDTQTDEEAIFHSCIVYGTKRKPPALNEQQWKHCNVLLSSFLTAQFPYQINDMVTFLVNKIEEATLTGDTDEFLLFTPLAVFTAVEGWSWAKEVIIDNHLIPLMVKFSEQQVDKKAFSIFCQLYADICYFCPNEEEPHEVFMEFFNNELDDGVSFVRDAAAMAQVKLLLQKKELLPQHLTEWISDMMQQNTSVEYVEQAERLFQRRIMGTEATFTQAEVHS